MSERPFMQLYVSDFIGDTLDLSTEQVGAYLLLLMAMWKSDDGSLKNEPTKLARVARVAIESWTSVWSDLEPYFEIVDGKVTNGRLSLELANFARKSAARAEAGSRGGKAKALKDKGGGIAIATPLPQHLLQKPEKKERARATGPTESLVKLDRYRDEVLFLACEKLTQPVRSYMQFNSWPADVVAKAQASLVH